MNPTIEQLRAVSAVARTWSFSEAARELKLTQPAVTRSIRSVETMLGLALFSRTTREVRLTVEGAEFVSVADEILRAFDDGLGRFGAWRRAEAGSIAVLALPSLAAGVLAPIVADFLSTHPDVRLELLTANADEILEQLRAGRALLAITEEPAPSPDLHAIPLSRDPVLAAVDSRHPLARESKTTWEALAGYPFVQLEEGTSVRRLTDAGFAAAGTSASTTISADTIGTVSALVSQGAGVSAFPQSTAPLISAVDVRLIPLGSPSIFRRLSIVIATAPPSPPLVRELVAGISTGWRNIRTMDATRAR